MNNVERMLLEQQEEDMFNKVISDDFSAVDSIIDDTDIDRVGGGDTAEEDKED